MVVDAICYDSSLFTTIYIATITITYSSTTIIKGQFGDFFEHL